MPVKYPNIVISTIPQDDTLNIYNKVARAMKRNNVFQEYDNFKAEAMQGGYNHVISTLQKWFTHEHRVEN